MRLPWLKPKEVTTEKLVPIIGDSRSYVDRWSDESYLSIVKGFAITLGLGVMLSMFSAIVITKTLLQLVSVSYLLRLLAFSAVDCVGSQ